MADNNIRYNPTNKDSTVILDNESVNKLFKILKNIKSINETITNVRYSYANIEPPIELLYSKSFIDKIQYYRIKKGITRDEIAKFAKISYVEYRNYELKIREIQDYKLAEKFIEFLEIEDILELPDYFKLMKMYPIEKIKEIIDNEIGKKEFCEATGINIKTVMSWYSENKNIKSISVKNYKKILNGFKINNII